MAQWQELLRLDAALQARVSQLYERTFPREVRHCLSVCIESLDWDMAALDEGRAGVCLHALLVHLEEQWRRSVQDNNILQGPNYQWIKHYLLKHFEHQPLTLAIILSRCLKEEKKILASAYDAQGCGRPAVEQKWAEFDRKVAELRRQTLGMKKEMRSLEGQKDQLDLILKTWQSQVEQESGLAESQAAMEAKLRKHADFITKRKQMVLQQIENILKLADEIVGLLTDVELPEWKRRQQMACLGAPADTCLDHLQKWFTTVAEVLEQICQDLPKLQDQERGSPDACGDAQSFTLRLFTKLLTNALVVEKQPVMSSMQQRPLILKTGVRFTVSVRFLANLPKFKWLLKVKPVFDKDVEEAKTAKGFRHFDFTVDNSKVLDVDSPGGGLVAEFGHMSLKENKVKARGSSESRLGVTEELHLIKFVTEFQQAGLHCSIEASSLPVVIISSTNQASSAWASMMWCNMLSPSEPRNLSLLLDPPPLGWPQLSQLLSWQFLSVGHRELDEQQLAALRDKLVDDPSGLVQWSKFSKNENAWIWIDGILDLIKKHLLDLWRDGFIMGFVSREKTQVLLQEKKTGTFLLRFSESIKDGAITFSWVEHCNGDTHVHAVEPYTKRELLAMPLPEIIYKYSLRAPNSTSRNPLLYLYPDTHKDAVFGRYAAASEMPTPKKANGYVEKRIVSESDSPTPPPSPPQQVLMIDPEPAAPQAQDQDPVLQELFSDLLDSVGPSFYSCEELLSVQDGFADPIMSF